MYFSISHFFINNIFVECGESNPVAVLRVSFSITGHCNRATPAVFPAVIRGYPLPTILYSILGFRVILQSFYLVYLRSNATSVAGHQPSYQSRHITFWCCKYDAVLFCVAETNTIHYQNHCHLVLHALRLPLLYFCIVHIL